MTKEIARTAGGKRVAWLLAILAAFAVFATVGNQWRETEAAVPTATATLSEVSTTTAGGAVVYTFTATFTPSGSVLSAAAAGAIVIDFDDDLVGGVAGGTMTGAVVPAGCTDSGATNIFTCASTAGAGVFWTNGTLTFSFTNPAAGTISAATISTCIVDGGGGAGTCTNNTTTFNVVGTSVVVTGPVAVGANATVTFTLPAGITYCSDGSASGANPRTNVAGDLVVTGLTVVSNTPTTANNNVSGTHTVVVRDDATLGGTVALSTHLAGAAAGTGCTTTTGTVSSTQVIPELRHVNFFGRNANPLQEDGNNVEGGQHIACVIPSDASLGMDIDDVLWNAGGGEDSINDPDPDHVGAQVFYSSAVATSQDFVNGLDLNGDGDIVDAGEAAIPAGTLCLRWTSTNAGDQQISSSYYNLAAPGTLFFVDWDTNEDGIDLNGDGDMLDAGEGSPANDPLIKEWNDIDPTTITISGGASGSGTTVVATANVTFNPASSTWFFNGGAVTIADATPGHHINSAGQLESPSVYGALVAINVHGACGDLFVNGTNTGSATAGITTGLGGSTWFSHDSSQSNTADEDILVNSAAFGATPVLTTPGASDVPADMPDGLADTVTLDIAGDPDCSLASKIQVTIVVAEPGPQGSGTGDISIETIEISLANILPTKQVFLAWAGQRIVLEHDWRLPPGDVDGGAGTAPTPAGLCPFFDEAQDDDNDWFPVTYVKGAGPGNFLSGLGALLNGSDQATVGVGNEDTQSDSQVPAGPNINCISRVLYESEDQGQVDIEAFVDPAASSAVPAPCANCTRLGTEEFESLNQTKIAFVIYYMKLEEVKVSLVDDVAKPTHNGTGSDYSPGNPWDASKDVTTVDWNVSKDLLVRGRVKGWFTSSNPSGRAAGTDSNGGGLPAGRWVMPDDWPLLAGGPADPADGTDARGIAEAFRPEFDIMIAPNNTAGRNFTTPEGVGASIAITTVAVAAGATGTITVADASLIQAGTCLVIDSEAILVTSKAGNVITGTRGSTCSTGAVTTAAAHAAGATVTIINLSGVPFEGPYSLLDIRDPNFRGADLAVFGNGSAALSDFDPNNVRDTIWMDGDVDMWDAPMPPSLITVDIRGAGFIKQVLKQDVYYIGTANAAGQVYPNPYYIVDIPDSPFIPAVVAGGGYLWDTWGSDGPGCIAATGTGCTGTAGNGMGVYRFWVPARIGSNIFGIGDTTVTATQATTLAAIRTAYGDTTIARTLVVYSDNHGEFMVTANGDFKLDYSGCATNVAAGGKHCKRDDKVGASTITAVADYPDFRGKHYPLGSNAATVNWTWGGYKDVTVEAGETNQYKYVVFHAMDRDGFCTVPAGAVSLHPVLSGATNDTFNGNPAETVDFLIDAGEGIIVGSALNGTIGGGNNQFATGVKTFSWAANNPAVSGIKEFPLSSLAATGATDECQAWIRVSNSLLGIIDLLVTAHDDEGDIAFDRIIDLQGTTSYTLSFRWTLITWLGADDITPDAALKGTESPDNAATNNIFDDVTAVYGWDAAAQDWLGFFPDGVGVPGANDLTKLDEGSAYWIAIEGPNAITWTVATNVN